MMKRQRLDDVQRFNSNCGLLKSVETRGILELVYSFLMDPDNLFESKDDELFFEFRTICKVTKMWSPRLFRFVTPIIRSQTDANKWNAMIPQLRNMVLERDCVKLSFLHLRSLVIHSGIVLNHKGINDWDCPLLEHFETMVTMVNNTVIKKLSVKFPNLKYLSVSLRCGTEVIVSGFPNLQRLCLSSNFKTRLRIHISDMPKLIDVEITAGVIDELDFRSTPNLKILSCLNVEDQPGIFNKLLFYDQVSSLKCLTMGSVRSLHHGFQEVDRNNHVHWENIKKLIFVYTKETEQICFRLRDIEELEISDTGLFPNINWSRLTHLKHLGWTNPSFDLLSCITPLNQNLISLTIEWENEFIMDFAMLLHFPNLQAVAIITTSKKYIHFEALFQLPKLKTLHCYMKNISRLERLLLEHWQMDQYSKTIKKQRLYFLVE
jgi:hypothetical protein